MDSFIIDFISLFFFAGAFWIFWTLARTLTQITSFEAFSKTIPEQPWPVKLMFINLLWFPNMSAQVIKTMGNKFLTTFVNVYGYFLYLIAIACLGFMITSFILQFGV